MNRRHFLRIVSAVLVAALVTTAVVSEAFAAPSKAELRSELNRLNDEARKAGRAYDKAYWAFEESDVEYARLSKKLDALKKQLKSEQQQLSSRAESWYRSDREGGFLEVLLASGSFEDFVTRLDYMQRISSSDANAISRIEKTLAKVRATRQRLTKTRTDRAAKMNAFKKKRDALQAKLKRAQERYDAAAKQLSQASGSGGRAVPGPNGMVFPVAGPNYYSDTWGASRGGGRRRHKGTDIMARTGTPCVATLSGTVSVRSGGNAGLWINLHADNGWEFWYMHLSSVKVHGGHVQAGEVIGYVGYSGNATANAPHLHYEIHPGGGAAVNPYPYLRGMQGR